MKFNATGISFLVRKYAENGAIKINLIKNI
jgi:hypothetical protein